MHYEESNNHECAQPYCSNNMERSIGGILTDSKGNYITNATVILYVSYIDICHDNIVKRLDYTTTDENGSFSFTIDLSKYMTSNFIVQAYSPIYTI